jgi:hypothetical protein
MVLGLGLLALIAPTISGGQQVSIGSPSDAFTITRAVLRIFYPEVFGKGEQVAFSAEHPVDWDSWQDFSGIDFTVKRFSSGVSWNPTVDMKTGKLIAPPQNTIFLQGSTWMSPPGYLRRFYVHGELANTEQNHTVAKLIESHREWSDEEAGRALKNAGAVYGAQDRDKFERSLDVADLEKSLGLRIASVAELERQYGTTQPLPWIEFSGWSDPEHEGDFTGFEWTVWFEARLSDGSTRMYAFTFEPFHGKLTNIIQLP